MTQSHISTVDYIDFTVNPGILPHNEGRIHWNVDRKTLEIDTEITDFMIAAGHVNVLRGRNTNAYTLTAGTVVYINGNSGQFATFGTASWDDEISSAYTIGIISQNILPNESGYAIIQGEITGINTNAYTPGTLLYLSSSGQYTNQVPVPPKNSVRLGQVVVQSTSGKLQVKVDNGYEIGELHDVLSVSASVGDLLVRSGSLWVNTKQLTGSYHITGSLSVNNWLELQPGKDPGTSNVSSSYFFVTSSSDNTEFNLHYRNNGALWETHWLEERTETGIVWGGILTFTSTTMSITPGAGLIINHNATTASHGDTTATYVPFGPITASAQFITSSQVTYLLIDQNGQLVQQITPFTPQQYNEKMPLGYIFCLTTSSISSYADARVTTYGQSEQNSEFVRAFGPLKLSGYDITAQSSSLKISIASGQAYRYGGFYSQNPESPSIYDSSAVATGSLVRIYRDPGVTGGFRAQTNAGLPFTDIDPTKWDNGTGILQTVSASQWTIQRIFQGVVNNVSYVYYGQNVYDSLALALQSITTDQFVESPTSILALPFIGYVIAKGDTSNLADTANNRIIQAGLFRNTAGSSGGGGAAAQSLDDLSDVTIVSPVNGQALVYNSGLWVNSNPTSASYAVTASYILQAVSSSYATTASFVATASYALTSSKALNILVTKAGSIAAGSFTGNPRKATVTFGSAFPNTSYAVVITGEDSRTWTVEGKLTAGFTASSNANTALQGTTYWIATAYGETT
jgi:hypothetical protein